RIVRDAALLRDLDRLGAEMSQIARRPTGSADEMLSEARERLNRLANGHGRENYQPALEPRPASTLRAGDDARPWIWERCISPGAVTLLSAHAKAGKTTLIAHLLRALEGGTEFAGLSTMPSRVLYVTEESETRWATRRDKLALGDHIHFIIRPFM